MEIYYVNVIDFLVKKREICRFLGVKIVVIYRDKFLCFDMKGEKMKLISFRIKNYKSIKDSKECYLENSVTIFAGKNGSGKSNILEALNKFSTQDFDFEEDNYNYEEECPIVINKYRLSEEELAEIKETFNVAVDEEVIITLDTNDNDHFAYEVEVKVDTEEIENNNKNLIEKLIRETGNEQLMISNNFKEVVENCEESELEKIQEALERENFVDIDELKNDIEEHILSNIPKFIYQKTIENELKSIITKESVKNNDFHKDIAKLLGFKESDFDAKGEKSQRTRRSSKWSQTLTGDFGTFYEQDKIDLKFTLDGDSITMDVLEVEKASKYENKIENKSDGLRWFIAFYAKLNVTKSEDVIILLDEPGMYLHAKACGEMLKIFAEISKESQILLATHNPYLIKADNLGAVRLVLNDENESTIIENKPHKYEQDKNMDTLTPILTSIGYELTMSIHVGDQKNNLITEGISDYYFIQGMAKLLNKNLDYLVIPSSSADKINYIASILIGWGLNTISLVDSDKKGKDKEKELRPLVDKCIFVSDDSNKCIEDLFSKEDYCQKILELEEIPDGTNSKIKKDSKVDEVLKAKLFCEKAMNGNIQVDKESKKNFEKLFETIEKEFLAIKKIC